MSDRLAAAPECREFRFGAPERGAADGQGRAVELDVETGQFRHHQGVVKVRQEGFVYGMRKIVVVEKPRFHLESENVASVLELARVAPLFGEAGFTGQAFQETLKLLRPEIR